MKTNGDTVELQALMNARLWACVQFVGGANRIAGLTGLSPQTFYNMERNRTFPSASTIKMMARAVPSLSIEEVYSDETHGNWQRIDRTTEPTPTRPELPAPPPVDVLRVMADLERERREKEKLQERYDSLSDRHEKLIDVFLKEKAGVSLSGELSFLLASSGTPTAPRPIGFQRNTPARYRPQVRTARPVGAEWVGVRP